MTDGTAPGDFDLCRRADDRVRLLVGGADGGSISMLSVQVGGR